MVLDTGMLGGWPLSNHPRGVRGLAPEGRGLGGHTQTNILPRLLNLRPEFRDISCDFVACGDSLNVPGGVVKIHSIAPANSECGDVLFNGRLAILVCRGGDHCRGHS